MIGLKMQRNIVDKMATVTDPVTKTELLKAFEKLGIEPGQIIEVHSSLGSFHHVIGGARTVVDALMEISGENGTLLMPVHTSDNSEPSDWANPGVAPELYQDMRDAIPPYDPLKSDLWKMGAIVENFRHRNGVVISNHPAVSYAAWGRYAKLLCNRQSFHFPLAEESPSARLYELNGKVLLLGVDFDSATCMHLAEYRTECRPIKLSGAKVATESGEEWRKYLDLDIDSSVFTKIRSSMARKNMIQETMLGGCRMQYFSAANAIDEATAYLERTTVFDLYR